MHKSVGILRLLSHDLLRHKKKKEKISLNPMVPFFMPVDRQNFEKSKLKDRKIIISLMREKYLLRNMIILWIKSKLLNNQKLLFYRMNLSNMILQNIACQTNFKDIFWNILKTCGIFLLSYCGHHSHQIKTRTSAR